jgi:hypothetical protein
MKRNAFSPPALSSLSSKVIPKEEERLESAGTFCLLVFNRWSTVREREIP